MIKSYIDNYSGDLVNGAGIRIVIKEIDYENAFAFFFSLPIFCLSINRGGTKNGPSICLPNIVLNKDLDWLMNCGKLARVINYT